MKKITSNPILISLGIFLTLLIVGILTSGLIVRDRLDHIVYGNKFMQIEGEYVSPMRAENDNLSTITVHLKNPALENEGNVTFQIVEGENVIREVRFTGQNIGDPGDVKLKFPPISDSGGKTYVAKLTTEQSAPKLLIFVNDENDLGGWFYNRNTLGFSGFIESMTGLKKRTVGDLVFSFIWLGSLGVVGFIYYRKTK